MLTMYSSMAVLQRKKMCIRDSLHLAGFSERFESTEDFLSQLSLLGNTAAASAAAAPVKRANQPAFLLDGLSLGFTLFALMALVQREKARFIVAEPCKPLVDWHQEDVYKRQGRRHVPAPAGD